MQFTFGTGVLSVFSPYLSASPKDPIRFLVWKDSKGKPKIHIPSCPNFGSHSKRKCSCPSRLAAGTVDTVVAQLGNCVPFLGVDTLSVETTFGMEQNMQMCHSLRCKQIDMSTADQLKSIFPNNAGTPKLILVELRRHMHAQPSQNWLKE